MFERYTEKARRVIFFARYEASQFGAQAIEAEHILLGLLRDDKQLVQRLFPTPDSAVEAIRREFEKANPLRDKVSASVDLPLSPTAKRVLMYAADASDRLGDRHIGTEHLLLGILSEDTSLPAELLVERGITAEKVIAAVKDEETAARYLASPPGIRASFGSGAGGARLLDPTLLQFFQQFKALIDVLIERGVISPGDVITQKTGFDSMDEGPAGVGWSFARVSFTALLDVLVSKRIISAEEKQRIIDAKV